MKVKKHLKEEGEHEVNITVTIAKCSPTVEKDPDPKKTDVIQVQNYFHCEYKLLPEDKDFIRTDVVTFGDAAKLYADNDSKVLRVWLDGAYTWVAWTNNRRIRVTQDTLLRMFKHKCELKFWDTKDKVSAKARFDRPKAFRLPTSKAPDEVDLENVRSLLQLEGKINRMLGVGSLQQFDSKAANRFHGAGIISQSTIDQEQSDRSTNKKVSFNGGSKTLDNVQSSNSNNFISTTDSKLEVKIRLDKNKQPQFKNLMSLASSGVKPLPVDTEEIEFSSDINSKQQDSFSINRSGKRKKSKDDTYASLMGKYYISPAEKIYQNGLSSVSIALKNLFTSSRSVSNCLQKRVGSVEELIVILTLDTPLLSEIQGDNLNPMTLTIGTATQMPDNGMSFKDLSTRCIPPFVKYKFHDSPEFLSTKKSHQKDFNVNEYDVILLGAMSKALLREFLLGPPLKIEIHDRDPKECLKEEAGIFGSQPDDEQISNITYTTSHMKNSGFDKSYNISYGVAEFDLTELLKGERILSLISPIRNFSRSSIASNNNATNSVAKTKGFGIPPGDYLGSGSELKIKIELSRSLTKKVKSSGTYDVIKSLSERSSECPFNRMAYIFDYKNRSFLKKIITEINEINATALNLLSYPPRVIAAALSTYKLTDEQKEDKTLDIITGCQIIDGYYHMFIVEGISDLGIRRLWEKLEHPEFNEDSFFRLLYNSSMSFSQRIYLSLDVDLTRVRLHQPLSDIVRQPLLYVRDILPNNCFRAVTKLYQLTQCTSLHNAVRNEMLPSAEMIVSLAKEFGVPLTDEDGHENYEATTTNTAVETSTDCVSAEASKPVVTHKKMKVPLDMDNKTYERLLEERKYESQKDFICSNIKSLLSVSKARANQPTVSCDTIETAHNYSTQSLNSTKMAKEKLRKILATDPESRFTYCQQYNSATVVPVSVEKVAKEKEQISKDEWKTENGFIFPGFKSSLQSNAHPKQIDLARKHELNMPWRENILHRNVVRPCVDRLLYKWEDRDLDFDTWLAPPEFFGKPAPVTIHAAGDTLASEKLLAKMREESKWKERLVVDDSKFQSHRCLMATELTDKGPKSSNQQDRLVDILKGDPEKLSLTKPGMTLSPIPALSVVSYPNVEQNHQQIGDVLPSESDESPMKNVGFHPGEEEGKSWSRDINTIPIYDYRHSYFEKIKVHDFRLAHTDREKALPKIKPLDPIEKENHLFLVK